MTPIDLPKAPRFLVFRGRLPKRRPVTQERDGIGNSLTAVPVIRALREHCPKAQIDVFVDYGSQQTLINCPYVNQFIRYAKRHHDLSMFAYLRLVRSLRRRRYDVVVICKRSRNNEILAWLSGAPVRVGFDTPGRSATFRLTHKVLYDNWRRVADNNTALLEPLGVKPVRGAQLEFWWTRDDERNFLSLAERAGISHDQGFVVFHTMAGTQRNCVLPPHLFAQVAERLRLEQGLESVYVFGPDEEQEMNRLRAANRGRGLYLMGETLGTTACAMRAAQLFVGHDSGPSHIAEAVGLPGLIVYTGANWMQNVRRWKPPGSEYKALVGSTVTVDSLYREIAGQLRARGKIGGLSFLSSSSAYQAKDKTHR